MSKKILRTSLSLLLLFLFSARAFADSTACPPEGEQHKYLDVPINFEGPADETYKFHYKLQNGFSTTKKTLILLHGGPGDGMATFDSCTGSYCFSELSDRYNIVTVDERGAGCSLLPDESAPEFMTNLATVEDIEALRLHLVGAQGQISIFGVSYGTDVAVVYTSRHEDHVEKLVIEGSMYDFKYTLHSADNKNFEALLEAKPDLKPLWKSLSLNLSRGDLKISMDDFINVRDSLDHSYVGMWVGIPKLITELSQGNYTTLDLIAAAEGAPGDTSNVPQAFQWVWCRELFNVSSPKMVAAIPDYSAAVCAPAVSSPFNPPKYRSEQFTHFKTPTLLTTGRWDSVLPASANALKIHRHLKNSKFFEVPFASHGVMWDRRACDIALISSFLDNGLTSNLNTVFQSDTCQKE